MSKISKNELFNMNNQMLYEIIEKKNFKEAEDTRIKIIKKLLENEDLIINDDYLLWNDKILHLIKNISERNGQNIEQLKEDIIKFLSAIASFLKLQ